MLNKYEFYGMLEQYLSAKPCHRGFLFCRLFSVKPVNIVPGRPQIFKNITINLDKYKQECLYDTKYKRFNVLVGGGKFKPLSIR